MKREIQSCKSCFLDRATQRSHRAEGHWGVTTTRDCSAEVHQSVSFASHPRQSSRLGIISSLWHHKAISQFSVRSFITVAACTGPWPGQSVQVQCLAEGCYCIHLWLLKKTQTTGKSRQSPTPFDGGRVWIGSPGIRKGQGWGRWKRSSVAGGGWRVWLHTAALLLGLERSAATYLSKGSSHGKYSYIYHLQGTKSKIVLSKLVFKNMITPFLSQITNGNK